MMNVYHTTLAEGNGEAVKLFTEGSRSAKPQADEQKQHTRPSLRQVLAAERGPDFTGYRKCKVAKHWMCKCRVRTRMSGGVGSRGGGSPLFTRLDCY